MTESSETLIPMNLSFSGRASDPRPSVFGISREDEDPGRYDRTVEEVHRLRGIKNQIAAEIEKSLFDATGLKFTATLSFNHGSVEFQGIVSTLATAEIFQAAANFGGALALAQTIATVINSVVAPHLPEWMSRPVTTCRLLGQVNPPKQRTQPKARTNGTTVSNDTAKELRAIKWLLLGLLIVLALGVSKYMYAGVA
jgi:hypothetical protein